MPLVNTPMPTMASIGEDIDALIGDGADDEPPS
jgi:hypothetical protein